MRTPPPTAPSGAERTMPDDDRPPSRVFEADGQTLLAHWVSDGRPDDIAPPALPEILIVGVLRPDQYDEATANHRRLRDSASGAGVSLWRLARDALPAEFLARVSDRGVDSLRRAEVESWIDGIFALAAKRGLTIAGREAPMRADAPYVEIKAEGREGWRFDPIACTATPRGVGTATGYATIRAFTAAEWHAIRLGAKGTVGLPPKARYSLPALRAWYEFRVRTWKTSEPPPSEAADIIAAGAQFDPKPSRAAVRAVRGEKAPAEWRKQGPRTPQS